MNEKWSDDPPFSYPYGMWDDEDLVEAVKNLNERLKILEENVMGIMQIMDREHGHKNEVWDPNNADEVATARSTFNQLKAIGYVAFKVGKDGEKAEIMTKFDPKVGKMIMSPAPAGG